MVPKRVAVVGAGPSGLVTVKELLEEGHEPTCFERAGSLGGVFRFGEEDGVRWDSVRLVSSGLLTAFSDFPVPADRTGHMRADQYVEYLAAYAEAFALGARIRFRTTVELVTRTPEGGWLVATSDAAGHRTEEAYDAVAVCAGLNQHPHRPRLPGEETFAGTILHVSRYRRPEEAAGKRVVVVGGGESGADVAAEVSEHAAETVLSLRRGVAVVPRRARGAPNDHRISRINHSAAHWVAHTRDPQDDWKRRRYRLAFPPGVLLDGAARALAGWGDLLHHLHPRRLPRGRAALDEVRTRLRMRRIVRTLLAESGGTVLEQFGTKTDDFVRALAEGRCRRAGAIARLDGRRVLFEDGETCEADLVILCTGFEPRVPFLDGALAAAPRYLHTFVPALGPSLGFVGFARPAHGAIPPLAELQARYFALVLSGRRELPPAAEMEESVARLAAVRERRFRAVRGRLGELVDYTSFCDELAAAIGCRPTRAALRGESRAFRRRFLAGPFVAAQYRLVGPHAKPALARATIEALPIRHPRPLLAAFYLRWWLTRALHRAFGPEFAPKLSLDPR